MCYIEVGEVVGERGQGTVESVEKRRVLGPVEEELWRWLSWGRRGA